MVLLAYLRILIFAEVPKALTDALYGTVQGAAWNTTWLPEGEGIWLLPCAHELNLTFVFGGQKIFVHPFDVSATGAEIGNPEPDPVNGQPTCIGVVSKAPHSQETYLESSVANMSLWHSFNLPFLALKTRRSMWSSGWASVSHALKLLYPPPFTHRSKNPTILMPLHL